MSLLGGIASGLFGDTSTSTSADQTDNRTSNQFDYSGNSGTAAQDDVIYDYSQETVSNDDITSTTADNSVTTFTENVTVTDGGAFDVAIAALNSNREFAALVSSQQARGAEIAASGQYFEQPISETGATGNDPKKGATLLGLLALAYMGFK